MGARASGEAAGGYRPDIDGLRAIAVGAVVLFHAGASAPSGGFVGVDVFFVISGFLITSLLYREMAEGRYSIAGFYERRIRRIFPALFATYVGCFAVAYALFLPVDFADFANSMAASAIFLSNLLFHREAGYFDDPAHEKPLLHTWSLSIEEQFYVLWPLLLWLLVAPHRTRRISVVTSILIGASLAYAEWLKTSDASAAFYLLPARAWELLLGALLAFQQSRLHPRRSAARAMSWAGMGLVVVPMFALDASSSFPGLTASMPCVGTALLIASGVRAEGSVYRLLSNRWMVRGGLISYSLYMLHWPMFTFSEYYFGRPLRGAELVVAIPVCVAVAALSWRCVEQPFRSGSLRRAPRTLVLTAGVFGMLGFGVLGFWVDRSDGLPGRVAPAIASLNADLASRNPYRLACGGNDNAFGNEVACNFGSELRPGGFDIVVAGDSHANQLVPTFALLSRAAGLSGRQLTSRGCPPVLNAQHVDASGTAYPGCQLFAQNLLKFLDANPNLELVVLAGRWDLYTEGNRPEGEAEPPAFLIDAQDPVPSVRNSRRVLRERLEETVERISERGVDVLLVSQVPPFPRAPIACMKRQRSLGNDSEPCRVGYDVVWKRLRFGSELLGSIAGRRAGVHVFSPADVFCDPRECWPDKDGVYLYADNNHLNRRGAEKLAEFMPPLRSWISSPSGAAARRDTGVRAAD